MTPTPTQRDVLRRLAAAPSQSLERRPGGYWCLLETEPVGMVPPEWSITVQTVRAMERAGWLARTHRWPDEWRDERVLTAAGLAARARCAGAPAGDVPPASRGA